MEAIDVSVVLTSAAIARDSTPGSPWGNLFLIYLLSGRTTDALALLDAAHDTTTFPRNLVKAQTYPAARRAVLHQLEKPVGESGHRDRAFVYAFLGDHEAALAELEKAVVKREPQLETLKVDPEFAQLRRDPRFAALLARIGLPP